MTDKVTIDEGGNFPLAAENPAIRSHKYQLPNNSAEVLTVTHDPCLSQQQHGKLHSDGFAPLSFLLQNLIL